MICYIFFHIVNKSSIKDTNIRKKMPNNHKKAQFICFIRIISAKFKKRSRWLERRRKSILYEHAVSMQSSQINAFDERNETKRTGCLTNNNWLFHFASHLLFPIVNCTLINLNYEDDDGTQTFFFSFVVPVSMRDVSSLFYIFNPIYWPDSRIVNLATLMESFSNAPKTRKTNLK